MREPCRDESEAMAVARLLLFWVFFFIKLGSSSSLQECPALLRLAGKLAIATNCSCTFPPTQASPKWTAQSPLPNWTAAQSLAPLPFVGCAPPGFPVRELRLRGLGLQGNISWVEAFKHVQILDLSVNNLSGCIPPSLWSLPELTHVNISFNRFDGSLSDLGGSASSPIRALDFSHNSFAGHVSQNLCLLLPNLTQLDVSSNNLTGYMNLSSCRRLESLDASFNSLQGPLFDDLAAENSLKSINLKKNFLLNGSIPNLSSFPGLVYLDVSFNGFNGRLGFEDNDLPSNLSTVNVAHNHLEVGLSTQTIARFGLPSFWPNKACEGCFPPPPAISATALSASPSPPASVTVHYHETYQKSIHADSKLKQLDMIIGGVAGGVGAAIIIAILCCLCIRKRDRKTIWPPHTHKRSQLPTKHCPELGPFCFESQFGSWIADVKDPSSVSVVIFQKPLLNLTFADLLLATKSFDREFEVGDGTDLAYACVVPGVVADNAKVTIKLIEQGYGLSNTAARAAFAKMGELKHENLVPLLGYCIVGEEKLLIYEHMEGGSLEDALHAVPEGAPLFDSSAGKAMAEDWCNIESWPDNNEASAADCSGKPFLDWKARHNIAMSVARALAYLHNGYHQPIVHGAVSSSCILLDMSAKRPRLANYGGAWGLPRQQAPGCVAPECRQSTQTAALQLPSALKCRESVQVVATYSAKCDVYAMGVVLLELATGKPAVGNFGANSSGATLVSWVRSVMKGKSSPPERAVDPKLRASPNLPQLMEMMKVGYLCTADSPSKRPSMQQVVGLLKDLCQS